MSVPWSKNPTNNQQLHSESYTFCHHHFESRYFQMQEDGAQKLERDGSVIGRVVGLWKGHVPSPLWTWHGSARWARHDHMTQESAGLVTQKQNWNSVFHGFETVNFLVTYKSDKEPVLSKNNIEQEQFNCATLGTPKRIHFWTSPGQNSAEKCHLSNKCYHLHLPILLTGGLGKT